MPASLVASPALEWAAGQSMAVRLDPIALPAGRSVSDFASFTLTIREDPQWPRSGLSATTKASADPKGDGWAQSVSQAAAVTDSVPVFSFTSPSGAGVERYAVDIWGTLPAGSEVQLYAARWLTILARVK